MDFQQIPVTLGLIFLNVALFFLLRSNHSILLDVLFIPSRALKRPTTWITSGFAHESSLHLLFNMIGVYYAGSALELNLGIVPFLVIYLVSIVAGSLLVYLLKYKDMSYAALGASAGVYGLFAAVAVFFPESKMSLIFLPIPVSSYIFITILTVAAIVISRLPRANEAHICHEGHLGGTMGGLLSSIAFMSIDKSQNIYQPWIWINVVLIFVFTVLVYRNPNIFKK